MKKVLLTLFIVMLAFTISSAGTKTVPRTATHSFVDTITISADDTDVALPAYWYGYYLVQVFVLASADDAFTLTVNQHNGGQWGTITTTAATTGEYMPSDAAAAENRYITGTPVYTMSGLGSGTVTIECVLVQ